MNTQTVVRVTSDNYENSLFTMDAYRELRLSMSTGDFHTHTHEIIETDEHHKVITLDIFLNGSKQLRKFRCYDNGGETVDRYTVVFMDFPEYEPGTYTAVGMSSDPFHPQGFGQHCIAMPGKHLGKRIKFSELPEDCQKLVSQDLSTQQKQGA